MIKSCSLKPMVLPYKLERPVNWDEQFGRCADMDVEIGFGLGEFLLRTAKELPDRNFIGIEQHWKRIEKTLRAVRIYQLKDSSALNNLRILKLDARVAFERLFSVNSITNIYCLFPCPWPKKGHIKHRLFSKNFLRLLNSRLKERGALKIITDFYPYREWILSEVQETGFEVKTQTATPQYNTKFERKWRGEGQEEFFQIDLHKKTHVHVNVREDVQMKNYVLDGFDATRFKLNDTTGSVSVIFKDIIFDHEKQKMIICAVVAEEQLTQHFWISLMKKKNKWHLSKMEGQNFFPTEGTARALDSVYEAAKNTCDAAGVNG